MKLWVHCTGAARPLAGRRMMDDLMDWLTHEEPLTLKTKDVFKDLY